MENLQTWHYGVIVGGVLLLLCGVLYFLPARKIKVPGGVGAGFGGLAAGLTVGVIWLAGFGYKSPPTEGDAAANEGATKQGPPPGPGAAKGDGAPKGKGGPGAAGPANPRAQLINLIDALDKIVGRPATVAMTANDRATIAEQLKGLDSAEEIKNEDATAKVEAILKVVEKDRQSLEAVGYQWPAAAVKKGFPTAPPAGAALASANPFKAPDTAKKIKSLQDRLK